MSVLDKTETLTFVLQLLAFRDIIY